MVQISTPRLALQGGNMPKVVPEYKDEARKKILKAAVAEFAKNGFRETKVEDIAKRVGVSKAALYHYFEDKEALVSAVAGDAILSAMKHEFSLDRPEPLLIVVKGAFGRTLDFAPKWFPGMISEIMSEAQRNGNVRHMYDEVNAKLLETISDFMEERKKRGEIPQSFDSGGISKGLLALQTGLMGQVSVGLPRKEAVVVWEEIVDIMAAGLEHMSKKRT